MSDDRVRVWINGIPLDEITRVRIDAPVPGSPEWRQEREATPPPDPHPFDTEPLYAHDAGEYLTVLQGGVYRVEADLTPFAGQRIAELMGVPLRVLGFPSAFDHRYRRRQRNRVKRKRRRG